MQDFFDLSIIQGSVAGVWNAIVAYLPQLVGAIIVFLLGLLIASVLRKVVVKVVEILKLDELAKKFELRQSLERYGLRLHIGNLLGWIVKWFIIIVALIATTDILGWDQVTDYLKDVVGYIPNVIIAVVILLAGIILANFVQRVVKSAVEAAKLESAGFLSGIARWAILVFTFMAALVQLQIAEGLIQILFTGLVAMLALAGGLAFGLGGREHASRVLDRLRRDISTH
jgi:hypothetical protein